MSLEYLKKIKELEENKSKSLSMLAQENDKFEKMFSMGRDYEDMRGIGSNSNVNRTFSSQKIKNVFVKAMGKANAQVSHKGKVKVFS